MSAYLSLCTTYFDPHVHPLKPHLSFVHGSIVWYKNNAIEGRRHNIL